MPYVDSDDAKPDKRLNRPQRNNNPGNIEYGGYAKSQGAVGSDGRFAVFKTPQEGFRALENLLQTDRYQKKTLAGAVSMFAPSHENNTPAYIRYVENRTGIPRHTRLSELSPEEIRKVALAKATYEGWKPVRSEKLISSETPSRRADRVVDADDDTPSRPGRQKRGAPAPEAEEAGSRTMKPERSGRRTVAEEEFKETGKYVRTGRRPGVEPTGSAPDIDDPVLLSKGTKPSAKAAFSGSAQTDAPKPEASRAEEAPPAQKQTPMGAYPYDPPSQLGFSDRTEITFSGHRASSGSGNEGIKTSVDIQKSFAPAAVGVPQTSVTQPAPVPEERPAPKPSNNMEFGWNG